MPRRVEALKPQAEFAERTGGGAGGSRRPRARIVGRVLKQHCCGMEAEKRASDETLCQVLNGHAEDPQGEYEIRWAFETMGPDALAALHTEGNVSLDRLAAAKRRSQSDPRQEDRANAWLNAALAKEQGLKLEQQIQDVAAHAKRAPLAVLAGAGISKPPPSGVPLYHELAIELAGATPGQAAEDPGACFDRVRKDRGEAIYEQAAERVRGRTEPNELHRRVVALHSAAGSRTIITTNWDELIEAAGAARGEPLRVWPEHERGPEEAGHRASGLVHLHGTASEPGGMLLTKTDLERHYTQERERRFVGELVGDRSMLCIGYSHRDVMIRKIQESVAARERAREGEDGQGRRKTFSLVKRESGKPGWEDDLQRLKAAGIEPVLYDRHEEVPEILDRVARAIAQDAEAEKRRLEAMAKQGSQPDTDWNEIGRLLEEGGPRLENFLREAAPEAWAAPEFMQAGAARVLRDEAGGPDSDRVSRWLCNGMDGERLRTVLWMAAKAGGRIGPALRYRLARSLGDSETTVGDAERERGALFLIGQCESAARGMNGHLPLWRVARRCSEAGRYEASIQGWAAVAKVYAAAGSKPDIAADGSVKETGALEPRLNVEGWDANEFYAKAVRPWMEQIHEAVWDVCAHALERQQRILETACDEEDPWNHWSGIRLAIEEHEQDGQRSARGVDALIDAARDALESGGRAGRAGREKWEARIRQAGASKNALLNRLAVHGVTESGHWSADRKVRWLGESGLLGNPWCKHEVYRLLKEHWKRARGTTRQAVGRRICRLRIRGGSREGNERVQYVLLGWMEQWGPLTQEMKVRQRVLQSRHEAWEMPAHPDFRYWHSGGVWIGSVAPPGWVGPQLVDDWKTRGQDALDRVIEEWENPAPAQTPEEWLHEPNEEGRQESVGDAIRLDRKWGFALAKRLIELKKWKHGAWYALCRELPKRMEPMELIEWAREKWWREVWKGGWADAPDGIPRGLATHLREGHRGEVDVREAVETLEEWALGTLKGDERPQDEDWTNHCINTTAGTAIEGIVGVAAGEAGGSEDGDAAFAALGRLWNASPAMRNHVATLCTNKLDVLAQRGEEWIGAHLVQAVEDEGSEELRRVVWGAMKYTRWTQKLGKTLKNAMERELMHEEAPGETDACAERYAWSMLRDVLDPSEGGRGGEYESWKVAEFPAGHRATVVAELAHYLWTNEETRAKDAWGRILLPLWRDVCDNAEGGTSEGEQSSFLHCFAFLNEGQQDEFRACFRKGPAVAPERFLDVDYGPNEVENRMAALEVALHCAGGYGEHDAWKWTAALETIAGWARAPKSPEEGKLAYNVLAKTGHTM